MPFPVAHGLVGASVVAVWRPEESLSRDWKALLFGAVLAVCPDLDFFFVWILHWRGWHRGFTHSIMFALISGCLMWAVLGTSRLREAAAYGSAVLSHALLDFSTTKLGSGVELLWPFSIERFKLGVVSLSEFGLQHALLRDTLKTMFKAGLVEFLIFAPLLLIILWLRKIVSPMFRSEVGAME